MSAVLQPAALATFDDDAWDDLLDYIEDRRVIPIVGPELLRVETDSGPRLLYDWLGGWTVRRRLLRPLLQAGGKISSFLPITRLRSRLQINLRNHRKIAVFDGRTAFTGGMNIGDEYLGKKASVGYWRDTVLRLEGPAVAGLQRIFTEDWDFAYGEALNGPAYFPELPAVGNTAVQVVESGPDQERNTIRELYFAALTSARAHFASSPASGGSAGSA